MPVRYREDLRIPPLPRSDWATANLTREYAATIATSGTKANAARKLVDAVIARSLTATSSEPVTLQSRLQRLGAQVYTQVELERLMINTFDELGLKD